MLSYPILTILGQSLGSVLLGYEALSLLIPDVFIGKASNMSTYINTKQV
jgi:alpha-1,2-mannosyltransferase